MIRQSKKSHLISRALPCRLGAVLLAGVLAHSTAQAVTIYGKNDDRDVRDNGTMGWIGETIVRVGGASSNFDAAAVYVFELPALDPGESILSASFEFEYLGLANTPSGNVDLHGLPYQSSSTVTASQYYDGPFSGDPNSTAIQDDILTISTSAGTIATDSTGSTNLAAYLNAQYGAGAQGGDHVFLRLNSDVTNETNYRYYEVATGNSSTPPALHLTIGVGGGGTPAVDEDFSAGAPDFSVISGGTWSVSNGRYVISSPASGGDGLLGNMSVHNAIVSGDYTVSAIVRLAGTSSVWDDAALIFGFQDEDNLYYVSLNESNDSNTKGVFKVVNGTPTELADLGSLSVSTGTDYAVEVQRSGNSITVLINQSQVASFNDTTFYGGQFGFGTKNDSAEFDDLLIYGNVTGSGGGGGGGTGAPTRVPSFGPNGTHWPSVIETPFMYDDSVQHIIEVNCSWSAIASALGSVTSTEASEGVLILVKPGSLSGNGSGSTSTPVLQNLGSASWTKRVTVAPRDGWGSVTVSSGARIFKVQGVCFAGFDFDSLAFHANNRSALAWTRVANFLSVNGTAGETIRDVEIVEVVIPDSAVGGADSADCYSMGATETSNHYFVGVYMAPRYRPSGSSAHTDTLQFEETSSGSLWEDIYILDSAFFASSNCAIQVGAVDGMIVEHTYIAGGAVSQTRYPFPSGASTSGANNCFNGSGNGGGAGLEAYDSYFLGGISGYYGGWTYADNTRTTYTGTNVPVSGSWIVDSTLDETNPTMPPYPTTTYLDSIWGPP